MEDSLQEERLKLEFKLKKAQYQKLQEEQSTLLQNSPDETLKIEKLGRKLQEVNLTLQTTLINMQELSEDMAEQQPEINTEMKKKTKQLKHMVKKLQKEKNHIDKLFSTYATYYGDKDQTSINLIQNEYQLMAWTLGAITIGFVIISQLKR